MLLQQRTTCTVKQVTQTQVTKRARVTRTYKCASSRLHSASLQTDPPPLVHSKILSIYQKDSTVPLIIGSLLLFPFNELPSSHYSWEPARYRNSFCNSCKLSLTHLEADPLETGSMMELGQPWRLPMVFITASANVNLPVICMWKPQFSDDGQRFFWKSLLAFEAVPFHLSFGES